MKVSVTLLLVAVLAIASTVYAKGGPCSALKLPGEPKGKTYDLSPLVGKTFTAKTTTDNGQFTYTWSICADIACDGARGGVCQTLCQSNGLCFSAVAALWDPNAVNVIRPDGGAAGIGIQETNDSDRLVNIVILCDPKAKEATNPHVVASVNIQQPLTLAISHKSGCGAKKGLSGGSICLIILTVCLVLYFVLGFIWKKFKLGHEGFDAVPNFLWKDLPGLVADGFRYIINCVRGNKDYENLS